MKTNARYARLKRKKPVIYIWHVLSTIKPAYAMKVKVLVYINLLCESNPCETMQVIYNLHENGERTKSPKVRRSQMIAANAQTIQRQDQRWQKWRRSSRRRRNGECR